MSAVDQYILGSGVLYERLCLITEVLGRFVSSAPRAVDIAQLEKHTGRPAKELLRLCAMLCREQLLQPHPGQVRCWELARDASQVTLEDAFRCAMNEQAARARPGRVKASVVADAAPRREVDMLVMQATMGINQSVFQHLRQFSLDRLKVSAAGMFGSRRAAPDCWPHRRLSFS
jgi:DNA-binding IscR family transcriptional regulator